MNNPADLLGRIARDLDEVLRADTLAGLSDAQKMTVLQVAGEVARRVEAVVVETVASVDGRPVGPGEVAFCARFGCRSMNELVQRALRTDSAEATRIVKAGTMVRRELDLSSGAMLPARFPALREAMVDGVVGVAGLLAATGPIEQACARIGAADRLRADAELAEYARGLVPVEETDAGADADADADAGARVEAGPPVMPEDLKLLARVIVTYLDPDGAEPAEERAMRVRGIVLGRVKDGVIPIRGALLPETAGQLQRLFDAYLNPKVDGPPVPDAGVRFVPSDAMADDEETGFGSTDAGADRELPSLLPPNESRGDGVLGDDVLGDDDVLPSGDGGRVLDDRTRVQKQHDVLAAVLGIAARHGDVPTLGGAAPTLVVSVTAEDYVTGRGWAHVDGITDAPVSLATARHTACGGTIQRVTSDPNGRIIGIDTTDRVFTVHQRRAITLRDRECLIPGCHVPATWCEIHHVTEHARGGPTSTDNGVTLCWHHHRTLDTSGWHIRMHNGTPHLRGPAWWDPHQKWRTPHPRTRRTPHAPARTTAVTDSADQTRHRTRTHKSDSQAHRPIRA